MKKNIKIIIGVIILIPIIAIIGGVIWFEATTVSLDDLYGEKFEYGESMGIFPSQLNKENLETYAKYIVGTTNAEYKVFETTYYWVIEITGQGYFIIEKNTKEIRASKWTSADTEKESIMNDLSTGKERLEKEKTRI